MKIGWKAKILMRRAYFQRFMRRVTHARIMEDRRDEFGTRGFLRDASAFINSIDPISGPNIMKHGAIKENGDGTLTFRRPLPYKTLDT